jgi:hypothetical protein
LQKVTLKIQAGGKPQVFDFYGNPVKAAEPLTLEASPTPYYITGAVIAGVESATPIEAPDTNTGTLLVDFDKPDQLKQVGGPSAVLESTWDTPRLKGDLASSFVTEDGATTLKVELKPDSDPRKLLPRYAEFELSKPIPLKGRPHEFVFRVKGNSGWAQIMFELVDAKGRVWTSTGNQYAGSANAADPHGQSFVNFEGWQTMRFPVVGMYPGADQSVFWPRNYNWWAFPSPEAAQLAEQAAQAKAEAEQAAKNPPEASATPKQESAAPAEAAKTVAKSKGSKKAAAAKTAADGKPRKVPYTGVVPVDYPLTLKKIIVTLRPHILYLDEEAPMENQVIYLDNLSVTQPPDGL